MPIFEFKCLECEGCFELLMMTKGNDLERKCPECGSENMERILSCTNYSVGASKGGRQGASAKTRNCAGGSCTSYEIPGPNG